MTSSNYIEFWNETLRQIKTDLKVEDRLNEFDMWFSAISYIESKGTTIHVAVPSTFMRDQIVHRKYDHMIADKMEQITGKRFSFAFEIKNIQKTDVIEKTDHQVEAQEKNEEKPYYVDTVAKNFTPEVKPYYVDTPYSHKPEIKKFETNISTSHPDLNPNYTFDSFIPGDNITFAYNAALSVAKNINTYNRAYNPLLLYGGVGLGKTHLMQSIGNELNSKGIQKIIYKTAENFTNEFVWAVRDKTTQQFVNKYRKANVLLIDDIHFLQKKSGVQEELFHIFNALYESNKQIVFTCDRPLSELKDITERLKSRFGRGLNVDLLPPQYETRLAILEKKLENLRKQIPSHVIDNIPREVLSIIAQNVETNVRDLESCLATITGYAELTGTTITADITYNQLKDKFSAPHKESIYIETIQKVVAEEYNISVSDLIGKGRKKNIITARQIAMYLTQQMTEFSTTEIGNQFGGKNHTTVMYSCQQVKNDITNDSKLDYKIQGIIKNIKDYNK